MGWRMLVGAPAATAAAILTLPATAPAKVGDVVSPGPSPFVVIAEGKFPPSKNAQTRKRHDGRWIIAVRSCGDDNPVHARYAFLPGNFRRLKEPPPPCKPPTRPRRIHGEGVIGNATRGSWITRSLVFGAVDEPIDALRVISGSRWVRARLFTLTPEQLAPTGLRPGSKFFVRVTAPTRRYHGIAHYGLAGYASGELFDCVGECDSPPRGG